jgi:hypothetical protein
VNTFFSDILMQNPYKLPNKRNHNVGMDCTATSFIYPGPSTLRLSFSSSFKECIVDNILVGKPEGRRPLGRPRHRWEDNIKMDLREIGFGNVDWIHLAQDRDRWRALVNTVMNLQVP